MVLKKFPLFAATSVIYLQDCRCTMNFVSLQKTVTWFCKSVFSQRKQRRESNQRKSHSFTLKFWNWIRPLEARFLLACQIWKMRNGLQEIARSQKREGINAGNATHLKKWRYMQRPPSVSVKVKNLWEPQKLVDFACRNKIFCQENNVFVFLTKTVRWLDTTCTWNLYCSNWSFFWETD